MKRLASQAESLCRAVAPDLAGRPLYIVLPSVLKDLRFADGPLGFTSGYLDLILRPELERLGRWRGRGPAIVIDPEAIASGRAEQFTLARRRHFQADAMGIVLHELAHIFDLGFGGLYADGPEPEPDPQFVEFARLVLVADGNGSVPPSNGPNAAVPWHRHESGLIRIALHLAHRATAAGILLYGSDIIDAADYGLSSTWAYAKALGDEPARLADWSFEAIRQTAPPSAFMALWQADVRRWYAEQPTKSKSASPAACGRACLSPQHEQEVLCSQN